MLNIKQLNTQFIAVNSDQSAVQLVDTKKTHRIPRNKAIRYNYLNNILVIT